jgi:hypothetical protein
MDSLQHAPPNMLLPTCSSIFHDTTSARKPQCIEIGVLGTVLGDHAQSRSRRGSAASSESPRTGFACYIGFWSTLRGHS